MRRYNQVDKIEARIEKKTLRRKRLWQEGKPVPPELTEQLHELYDQLRVARARDKNGHRDGIVKRARIERELEKLMSD